MFPLNIMKVFWTFLLQFEAIKERVRLCYSLSCENETSYAIRVHLEASLKV